MINNVSYNKALKVGFFNKNEAKMDENSKALFEKFKRDFDVLIMNDGNFSFVNQIIKDIFC